MTSTCLCFQIEQSGKKVFFLIIRNNWAAPSEFGAYRLCEQRRFRRACASAQSRQNLRCSLIHALSQEEPSDRKLDPWPLWMVGHAQLKFVMTECSTTQIRLTGLNWKKILSDKSFSCTIRKMIIFCPIHDQMKCHWKINDHWNLYKKMIVYQAL